MAKKPKKEPEELTRSERAGPPEPLIPQFILVVKRETPAGILVPWYAEVNGFKTAEEALTWAGEHELSPDRFSIHPLGEPLTVTSVERMKQVKVHGFIMGER